MAESENLQKLKRILAKMADLIREAEGTSDPILVADMREKIAEANIATFDIQNGELKSHTVKDGTEDPTVPEDTLDYYRKLLTNFANKVRVGSEKLDVDQIEAQEGLVCGVHIVPGDWGYGIRIPDGVTSIGARAFEDCTELTSVIIPNSVTAISDHAFSDCSYIYSITIPNSVTSIGELAFFGCTELDSITIPNSVTSIGFSAFSDCRFNDIYFDGTTDECGQIDCDWDGVVDKYIEYIHCTDGDYEIQRGGGSGSGSGSGSSSEY